MSFARVSRSRAKNTLPYELKKAGSIEAYFEKLMRRRYTTESGVIDLPRRNLEDVLNHHVETEEDYKQVLGAFYNYLGHRNSFP